MKNNEFNVECYPGEIAQILCKVSMENPGEKIIKECEEAIYHLMATAQNPYNSDHFRVLYRVLENLVNTYEEDTL